MSCLAKIGAISEQYTCRVIVICEDFCFNSLHKSTNAFIVHPSGNVFRSTIVCVVTTPNYVFHEGQVSEEINAEEHPIHIYEVDRIIEPNASNRIPYINRLISVVDDIINGTTIEDNEIGAPPEGEIAEREDVPLDNPEITIDELFSRFFLNSDHNNISLDAYTSNERLKLNESQYQGHHLTYRKTYDIDGFFGLLDPKDFIESLNSPANFFINPIAANDRTLKNVAYLLPADNSNSVQAFKLGFLELSLGPIEIYVVMNSMMEHPRTVIEDVISCSSQYARSLPCERDQEHWMTCSSTDIVDGHISTRRATTSTYARNHSERYSLRLSICYTKHFLKKLEFEFEQRNIRTCLSIYFKNIDTKSVTRSENISRTLSFIKDFSLAFKMEKLDKEKVYVDFCVSVTASDINTFSKVTLNIYLFL